MNHVYIKQQVELAIKTGKLILMDYVSMKMKITPDRLVDPLEIKTRKDGQLAFFAHCHLRKDIREFMFDGVQSIKLVSKTDYGKVKELAEDRGDDSGKYEGGEDPAVTIQ